MRKLVLTTAALVLMANAAYAGTITVSSTSSRIQFGVQEVNGIGRAFVMENSEIETEYFVPISDVAIMYSLVDNNSWVTAQAWTGHVSALGYSHVDTGFGGSQTCCATIVGDMLSAPWHSVVIVRSSDSLLVSITTPEPSTSLLLLLCVGGVTCVRRKR